MGSHHILGIETNIALVWNPYYVKSLPGRYCYKVGIVSGHTQLVSSLTTGPIAVYMRQESIQQGYNLVPAQHWFGLCTTVGWFIEKMAGHQQASKSKVYIANLQGLKIGQDPDEEEP
jgi:hypothetical protein